MNKADVQKLHRILCLEDNFQDQELLEATLTDAGLSCQFCHVTKQAEFESALRQITYDLIISDYSLPSYNGLAALAAARIAQSETPFIFFSGTIGEERAVESLKSGATDYILKDRPDRLISAVKRALQEARERLERKRLEAQLRQSQKMEAIGQLAGGIAHDFNNLLSVIHGNAELILMKDKTLAGESRECLKYITAAAERATSLTRQLLAFGRKQTMQLKPANLNDVVSNLTKMLNRIIGEHISLECTYADHDATALADSSMVEQVLLNLVVNARDAMPHGGKLFITTKLTRVGETGAQFSPEARPGTFVCLTVTDTGEGIQPQHLPHIFEPFFTTKESGKGTGLGLATVFGIMKQHSGWIEVSSRVGSGTTFAAYFPTAREPCAPAIAEQFHSTPKGGTETILLVEDDLAVRSLNRRVLESFGYSVVEATSGRHALELWDGVSTKIDLIITDMVMPDGVTGRDLVEKLHAQKPALKIIIVSGYNANVVGSDTDFFRRNKSLFLQKPYPPHLLIDTVRQCLDG